MPAVDRVLLRIGLFELLWVDEIDDPVAITEAVELAKTLSTDDSPRFINGVLGRISDIAEYLRPGLEPNLPIRVPADSGDDVYDLDDEDE
jgi:N utilization substance protein B